jgi:hypothetical protein
MVFSPALSEPLFAEALALVSSVGFTPTDHCDISNSCWIPLGREPSTLVERVAHALFDLILGDQERQLARGQTLSRPITRCVGAECWFRVELESTAHAWHFDKDEESFETEGVMLNPMWGSILYTSALGGGTVLLDLVPVIEGGKQVGQEGDTDGGTVSAPEPNKYLVFQGNRKHGVLPTEGSGIRRTLLFNWWEARPKGLPDRLVLPGERQ